MFRWNLPFIRIEIHWLLCFFSLRLLEVSINCLIVVNLNRIRVVYRWSSRTRQTELRANSRLPTRNSVSIVELENEPCVVNRDSYITWYNATAKSHVVAEIICVMRDWNVDHNSKWCQRDTVIEINGLTGIKRPIVDSCPDDERRER